MSLTVDDIAFLQSDVGIQYLLDYALVDASEKNTLHLITELRKRLTLEQASAILTTVKLRQKAIAKFPHYASQMLFTETSLQQASDYYIREYRAGMTFGGSVLDVCCSIGSDAITYARAGCGVLGLDIDPVRIAIAEHNARVINIPVQFEMRDVTLGHFNYYDLVFYDPARRTSDGNRIFNVEQYIPPLSLVHKFDADEVAVKLSPAVDLQQLHDYGGQIEFISVNGDLKEAVLWLNRSRAARLATLLLDDGIHQLRSENDSNVDITKPRVWLFEPDPSVLRAGLVQYLAEQLNATMLDPTIAYLTMDEQVETVWGRYWQILDWMPFNLKKLKRYLVEQHVGNVTVKKRGFPMAPEMVMQKLKLKKGSESRTLVMTRCQDDPIVLICRDI